MPKQDSVFYRILCEDKNGVEKRPNHFIPKNVSFIRQAQMGSSMGKIHVVCDISHIRGRLKLNLQASYCIREGEHDAY